MAKGNVGSVSISVLPDTTGFAVELKNRLETLEKNEEFKLPVVIKKITFDKTELARARKTLREALNDTEVKVFTEADKTSLKRTHHALKQLAKDREMTIDADADTFAARLKLAWLTRPRQVKIGTVFKDTGRVAEQLAILSGMRAVEDLAERIQNVWRNFDRFSVRTSNVTFSLLALTDVLLGAGAGLINFGAGLAKTFKAGLMLPALLQSATIGTAGLVMALKDASTVLDDLGDDFKDVQKFTSQAFWLYAEKPLRHLAKVTLPELRRGFILTGSQLGVMTGRIADAVSDATRDGYLSKIFDKTAESIRISSDGLADMTSAIIELGSHGSQHLPRLAGWINDVSLKFKKWVDESARAGKLDRWIDEGIEGLKTLGHGIRHTSRLFAGLYEATNTAGTGMQGYVDIVERMADTVNRASFQTRLAKILSGAREGVEGLSDGIVHLGRAIGDMSPLFADMLGTAGKQIGALLEGLGDMLYHPRIRQGLEALTEGFTRFTNTIVAIMPSITPAIGSLMEAISHMTTIVGVSLGGALTTIAPLIDTLAKAFMAIPAPIIAAGGAFLVFRSQLKAFSGTAVVALAGAKTLSKHLKFMFADFKHSATSASALGQSIRNIPSANVLTLKTHAAGASTKLLTLRDAARKAGGALKAAFMSNLVTLGLMAVVSAISAISMASENARQKISGIQESFDELGNATEATRKKIYENLLEDKDMFGFGDDLVARFTEAGIEISRVIDAIMGDTEELNSILAELRAKEIEAGKNHNKVLAALYKNAGDAIKKQAGDYDTARVSLGKYDDATLSAAAATREHAREIQNQIDVQREANNLFASSAEKQLAARAAERQWSQVLEASAGVMADSNSTAVERQAALDNLALTTHEIARKQNEANASQDQLNETIRRGREEFISYAQGLVNTETGLKYTAEEAEALANKLHLVEGVYEAEVDLDAKKALGTLGDLIVTINQEAGEVEINGNPVQGLASLKDFADEIDGTTGEIIIDGNRFPAEATVNDLLFHIAEQKGVVSILGEDYDAREVLYAYLEVVKTGADVKLGANSYSAEEVLNALRQDVNDPGKASVPIGGHDAGAKEAGNSLVDELNNMDPSIPIGAHDKGAIGTGNSLVNELNNMDPSLPIDGHNKGAKETGNSLVNELNNMDPSIPIGGHDAGASKTGRDLRTAIDLYNPHIKIGGKDAGAGSTGRGLRRMIDRYNPHIKIGGRDAGATRTAVNLASNIDGMWATIKIGAVRTGLAASLYADGGIVDGKGVQRFADGGIKRFASGSERHVAQIAPAGPIRVWAEPETGGEAYIPLSPRKRDRSLAILREVADGFGYGLEEYADGSGGVLGKSKTGGGDTYHINVSVQGDTLRDINSIADFVDMLHVEKRMRTGI